jgi:RNA polymerase primary sigma factor
LTLPDLINEGNLGLIKAAQRFDETTWFQVIRMRYGGFVNPFGHWQVSRIVRLPLNKIKTHQQNPAKLLLFLEQSLERP